MDRIAPFLAPLLLMALAAGAGAQPPAPAEPDVPGHGPSGPGGAGGAAGERQRPGPAAVPDGTRGRRQLDGHHPPVRPGFHYYELVVDGFRCPDPNSETFFGWAQQTSGLEVPDPTLHFCEPRPVPHGEVRAVWYPSRLTGQTRCAFVYTPPGYDSGKQRYPVLYLQHGAGRASAPGACRGARTSSWTT
jgi:hypothetical protein